MVVERVIEEEKEGQKCISQLQYEEVIWFLIQKIGRQPGKFKC